MTYQQDFSPLKSRLDQAQARADDFGLRVSAMLTEQSQTLPHDFSERLRAARVQALAARKRPVLALGTAEQAASAVVSAGGGQAAVGGWGSGFENHPIFQKIGPFLPILALVAGFWIMSAQSSEQRIADIAAVDAAILKDEVPPAAYADPGFAQFIRDNR